MDCAIRTWAPDCKRSSCGTTTSRTSRCSRWVERWCVICIFISRCCDLPHCPRRLQHMTHSVETLNLGHNNLSNEGAHRLKESLIFNKTLLRVGLQSTKLTCEGSPLVMLSFDQLSFSSLAARDRCSLFQAQSLLPSSSPRVHVCCDLTCARMTSRRAV